MKHIRKILIVALVLIALVHIRFNTVFEDRFIGLTIEINHGMVTEPNQFGVLFLNDGEAFTNYCYTDGTVGDEFTTIFIYNPFSLGFDDISIRIDYNKNTSGLFINGYL